VFLESDLGVIVQIVRHGDQMRVDFAHRIGDLLFDYREIGHREPPLCAGVGRWCGGAEQAA